ncbi:MAG: hypothetical protein IJQ80_06625 [Clostridia bacterium]|nr:hypothetical protein [Clostridia bacterium]
MSKIFGIDTSLYQKGIDFKAARAEGVKYAILKCGEADFRDPCFEENYKRATSAGLDVGAYFFGVASDTAAAAREASFCASILKGKKFKYPIFYDVEASSMKVGRDKLTDIVKAFCTSMEKAGYWCGFYTNLDWYRNNLKGDELARRFSFWCAYWGKTKPSVDNVQMWQFGGETNLIRSNKIAGVVCDQDYSFVDFPAKIAAKGLNGLKKTASGGASSGTSSGGTSSGGASGGSANGVFRIGEKVKIKSGAPVWGSASTFAPWVYETALYVREISGSRVVVSTNKTGAVTGAVDKKYLIKI